MSPIAVDDAELAGFFGETALYGELQLELMLSLDSELTVCPRHISLVPFCKLGIASPPTIWERRYQSSDPLGSASSQRVLVVVDNRGNYCIRFIHSFR